jgi:hypothetical protein
MNRPRMAIVFGGLVLLGALGLVAGLFRSIPAAASASPDAPALVRFEPALNLRCDIKIPNGLAQCGSQASSCKNCHEVKGEDPVNAQGDWHISHAFGDFCEFCHGGNVQAPDQAAAHQGLVEPLGDVQANCSSCHEDSDAKAQTYAATLGVTIGMGGGSTEPPASSSAPSDPAPTPPPAPDTAAVPSGSEIVDYVAHYQSGGAPSISTGNLVVGGLLALTVAGGGAFVYWNEKRLRKADRQSPLSNLQSASIAPDNRDSRLEIAGELSPDLTQLLPALQSLDPRTLRALKIILSDRQRGEELLQSLSLVNFAVLDEMKRLDKRELSLLLALASEAS